jgi:isocitrate dehydrogenase
MNFVPILYSLYSFFVFPSYTRKTFYLRTITTFSSNTDDTYNCTEIQNKSESSPTLLNTKIINFIQNIKKYSFPESVIIEEVFEEN